MTKEERSVMPIHYVYLYFRLSGEPLYVGKGFGRRYKVHWNWCTNTHFERIINAAKAAGAELPVVILASGLTNNQALEYEAAWIAAIGRECDGTGPLVNFTSGGEGSTGYVPSSESREARRVKLTGLKRSPEEIEKSAAARRGMAKTEEQRLATSEGVKAYYAAHPEAIEAMKARDLSHLREQEVLARRAEAVTGVPKGPHKEEKKQAISEKLKAYYAENPESLKAMAERDLSHLRTPEAHAKVAASAIGKTHSEEWCENMSRGMKRYWEERRAKELAAKLDAAANVRGC